MILCVCRRVSDKTVAQCARAGMAFEDIQLELGVATQCGQCECSARALVAECAPSHPVAHLRRDTCGQALLAAAQAA